MRRKLCFGVILCLALAVLIGIGAPVAAAALQFNVSFAKSVHATPLDGRLLVIVSPTNDSEPRLQANDGWVVWGPPLWGMDVNGMQPGKAVLFGGAGVYGSPLASLDDLEPGDYYVQALLNVYTTFHRSDGSVVKLHMPAGEGQNPFISPGNLVSSPKLLHLDPALGRTFNLKLDQVLPPLEMVPPGGTIQQGNPPDSKHVRHIKIKSALLSSFWGRPIHIAATSCCPKGTTTPRTAMCATRSSGSRGTSRPLPRGTSTRVLAMISRSGGCPSRRRASFGSPSATRTPSSMTPTR
jgi:hypothetical protein